MTSHPLLVTVPLLNPNEPEALLAASHVVAGQYVSQGQALCTLETTKSTADLLAEIAGYVVDLRLEPGQIVRAGETFCYLAASPEWVPPLDESTSLSADGQETVGSLPEGLRITQPALALARQLDVDLKRLPLGLLVTEGAVRRLVQASQPEYALPESPFDPTAILVYGAGGHGKSVVDLLRVLGVYRVVGFIDDGLAAGSRPEALPMIMGLPLLGGSEALERCFTEGVRLAVNAVGGIGNVNIRIQVFQKLAMAGFTCPAIIHPTAFVEPSATLSSGVQVFPHAYVGSEARVGFGAIINTGSIVSHDCMVGKFANISPGAMLAGEVQVGDGALIGMGVTINLQVKIGAGARLGNGATVKSDVPVKGIVRAGGIWPE